MKHLLRTTQLKWSITGFSIICLIGIVFLVNPRVDASTSKKTSSTEIIKSNNNNNNSTIESGQKTNNTAENNSSGETRDKEDYLTSLNIILPQNWSIDNSQKSEYVIKDEKSEGLGLIDAFDYVDDFDLLKQKPNHSSVTKDEYINIPLGKCRLITLDSDNGTASSGITGTHNQYYAAIPVNEKVIYVLSFDKNDKKSETKEQFIKILKSLIIRR